jgi:hypothetical protein
MYDWNMSTNMSSLAATQDILDPKSVLSESPVCCSMPSERVAFSCSAVCGS